MSGFFKPVRIVLYLLALLSFFFIGLFYADWIEAGKNQGLAAAPIVLSYGVGFGGVALLVAFFLAPRLEPSMIAKLNWILFAIIGLSIGNLYFRAQQRAKARQEPPKQEEQAPSPKMQTLPMSWPADETTNTPNELSMGLGVFLPNLFDQEVLYFYAGVSPRKTVEEHVPIDSLVLKRTEHHQREIAYAPPWLAPELIKLDYELLVFQVLSVSEAFIEVLVNEQTGKRLFLNCYIGRLLYWPELLLRVQSVEFHPDYPQEVKIKPLEHSSSVNVEVALMRPLRVQEDWILVELQDAQYRKRGIGWIRWREGNHLLIRYQWLT